MNKSFSNKVNILQIIRGTTVDGPGFRTSIYFAGCRHKCAGCHNSTSWDFNNGTPYSIEELIEIIEEEDFDVTLSGGDPLYNPEFVKQLVERLKHNNRNIWIYSGFRWEEIISDPSLLNAVNKADVLVDSPFILSLRDPDLLFRGSSNQRIIDISNSLKFNKLTLWHR